MPILFSTTQAADSALFLAQSERLFCTYHTAAGEPPAITPRRKNAMNRPLYQSFLLALATTLGLGAAAGASASDDAPPYAAEMRSCIDEVYSRLDLDGAERVRHYISKTRRSRVGYVLYIDTIVFGGDSSQQYASYCLANGTETPVKFEIESKGI
jgi:hypothetical protein